LQGANRLIALMQIREESPGSAEHRAS